MEFKTELKMLLEEIDNDFIPPLSSTRNLDDYASKMYKNSTIFSVHEEGKLVAAMAVYSNDPNRNIAFGTMLAVGKSHRIYGLGPSLIKSTIDYLRKKSFSTFRLEIYKTNPRVITLYKRLKFIIISETDDTVFVQLSLT